MPLCRHSLNIVPKHSLHTSWGRLLVPFGWPGRYFLNFEQPKRFECVVSEHILQGILILFLCVILSYSGADSFFPSFSGVFLFLVSASVVSLGISSLGNIWLAVADIIPRLSCFEWHTCSQVGHTAVSSLVLAGPGTLLGVYAVVGCNISIWFFLCSSRLYAGKVQRFPLHSNRVIYAF